MRAPVEKLQSILDAPKTTTLVKDKPVPTVTSGLSEGERRSWTRSLISPARKLRSLRVPGI
jgi:hypothetical protein